MVCTICKSNNLGSVYNSILPYSSAILSNTAYGKITKGSFSLVICKECNFVFNNSFDRKSVDKYYSSENYVVKNILSGNMSKNIQYVFEEILNRTDNKKVVIEIGSGRGDFAINLSTKFEKVYTIDPSVDSLENTKKNIKHFNTFFDYKLLDKIESPNLIVVRHLLEHLEDPIKFLQEIDNFITSDDCLVYIEIPNFDEIVNNSRFYDLFYDHFGYYFQSVFKNILEKTNLKIIDTIEMFDSQHIGYFCKKNSNKEYNFESNQLSLNFKFEDQKTKINKYLEQYNGILIWGAGAHGLSLFYSLSERNKNNVLNFIDNDILKQKKFIPETDIQIVSSEVLAKNKCKIILVSASLYESEIANKIKSINNKILILQPSSLKFL
ncbi:class I SAM-dependent methyltransferase [Aliarcobacter butzleri]|uniref:class I SAM-dependent methyltransferase n=1 Tax=Aliarcobacter butzleri TaxID=28197 RepID=UPI0021B18305|nr:class I SAM-dependent methyltransferase [Aliarcobacter butzleri]MCT7581816.1 class I SAM-dependent methyltransferase [Aliarcobacter butzleri]